MDGGSAPSARSLLPGLNLLLGYRRAWLRPDMVAGVTVGAMLIPQSMAYAELAGLEPQFGFYAVIGALVVYAVVGSSRHLGVGPEPGTAILAATGVGAIAAGDTTRYVALMGALALVVAVICLVAAVARAGFVASVLSKPVLVGYISGVGLTLLSSQIAGFTGVPIGADKFLPRVGELFTNLGDVDASTLLVGAGTLGLITTAWRTAPRIPGALVGIVTATAAVALLSLDRRGVALVGTIPAGLPVPAVPGVTLAEVWQLLPVAAGIALVGYTDNVLTARSIAVRHGYRIDANQELFALGLTNLTSGLSGGFPISSSASRTAVPASLGSKTQLVSLVAAAFVVVTLVGLRPLLADIPRAALAAVVISAALTIIDVAGLRELWKVSPAECGLAVIAATGVVVFDVLVGVLVAVMLSIAVAFSRIARPHDAVLGGHPDLDGWVDVGAYGEALTEPGLLVYRFDAPLFFVNAERFADRVELALADNPGDEDWLVLDFEGVGAVDTTALEVLADLVRDVRPSQVDVVALARANDVVLELLQRAEMLEPAGPLRVFPTINSAVRAFRERPV